MNCSTVVSASSRPRPITTRCSAVSAISLIRWLDTNTVRPSAARSLQQGAHPDDALRVQAVDRLVEQQHRRVAEQRGGDAEPLAHAEREPLDPLAPHAGQPDLLEHLVDPRAPGSGWSARATAGGGGRAGRRAPTAPPAARRPAAAARSGSGRAGRRSAPGPPSAGRGPSIIRMVVDLPAPFGPEEAGHPTRFDGERQVVDRDRAAVALAEVVPLRSHRQRYETPGRCPALSSKVARTRQRKSTRNLPPWADILAAVAVLVAERRGARRRRARQRTGPFGLLTVLAYALMVWTAYLAGLALPARTDVAVVARPATRDRRPADRVHRRTRAQHVAGFVVFVVLPLLVGRYLAQHRRLVSHARRAQPAAAHRTGAARRTGAAARTAADRPRHARLARPPPRPGVGAGRGAGGGRPASPRSGRRSRALAGSARDAVDRAVPAGRLAARRRRGQSPGADGIAALVEEFRAAGRRR